MKDFDDIFKQRLEGYEMKLPSSDRDDFLNRKATRERYARRRRNFLGLAVGIPAAAAILCTILMSINLLSSNNRNTPDIPEQTECSDDSTLYDDADILICIDGDDDWGKPMETSVLSQAPGEEDVFMVVEESPEFPGGINALMGYLRDNMVVPDSCRENNIQGRVLVTFIVEKDGSITKPVVVKSVHPILDAEALRLVSAMPKWKPGRHKGEAQRVKYTIPVNFRIEYYKNLPTPVTDAAIGEDIMSSTKDKTF